MSEAAITVAQLTARFGWLIRREMRALRKVPALHKQLDDDFFGTYESFVELVHRSLAGRCTGTPGEDEVRIITRDVREALIAQVTPPDQ